MQQNNRRAVSQYFVDDFGISASDLVHAEILAGVVQQNDYPVPSRVAFYQGTVSTVPDHGDKLKEAPMRRNYPEACASTARPWDFLLEAARLEGVP